MNPVTAGLTAGSIVAGMIGKDIDYPWVQGTYQVVDGVAKQTGQVQTLDKGHKLPGQAMLDATIAAVNTALKGLGIYGQEGATYAAQPIGVVAGDRPGAVKGGFYTGFEVDKSKTNSKFLGGVRQDSVGFGTIDRAIEKAVENQVQSIYDSGGAVLKGIVDAAGGAHGYAAATAEASGLDIKVPSKFKASNFWTKLSTGLAIAATVSGGIDLANAVSSINTAAAAANASGATVSSFGAAATTGAAAAELAAPTVVGGVIDAVTSIQGIISNADVAAGGSGTGFDTTNAINDINTNIDTNTDTTIDTTADTTTGTNAINDLGILTGAIDIAPEWTGDPSGTDTTGDTTGDTTADTTGDTTGDTTTDSEGDPGADTTLGADEIDINDIEKGDDGLWRDIITGALITDAVLSGLGVSNDTADTTTDPDGDPDAEEDDKTAFDLAKWLGIGSTIVSAWLQSRGGSKAARIAADAALEAAMLQNAASDKAIEENRRQFDLNRADLQDARDVSIEELTRARDVSLDILDDAGYRSLEFLDIGKEEAHAHLGEYEAVGKRSLGILDTLINSEANVTEEFEKLSPGFNFRLQQGEQALENLQSSRGNLLSGRGVKEALRFNQNFASEEFGNYINRLVLLTASGQTASTQLAGIDVATGADKANITQGTATNKANVLTGAATNIANVNTGAATNLANLGTSNTNAINSLLLGQANTTAAANIAAAQARSGATINTTNAITGGISNTVNSLIALQQQEEYLKALRGQNNA